LIENLSLDKTLVVRELLNDEWLQNNLYFMFKIRLTTHKKHYRLIRRNMGFDRVPSTVKTDLPCYTS
jgi:hypothetical protein